MDWTKTKVNGGNVYRTSSDKYDFFIFKSGSKWYTDAKVSTDSPNLWQLDWNTSPTLKAAKAYVCEFCN